MEDIQVGNELEDIAEQAREVGKLTPREFAKLNGIAPQLIYYYIRTGKLELEYCVCGRRVIDVARATEVVQAQARRRGQIVDPRPDDERSKP